MKIAMQDSEIALLQSFLCQAKSYLEFGMGGSTMLAASLISGPIFAIDSSREWLERVRAELPDSPHLRVLIHGNIGEVGDWGMPLTTSSPDRFLNYHQGVWTSVTQQCDLYFIDGRFRVACFVQSLMHMAHGAVVGMHDYSSRSSYHVVETVARPIASAQDITFFIKKKGISCAQLQDVLEKHKFDPY